MLSIFAEARRWEDRRVGKLALAAKVTHVPSMYLSELPGPHQGCRAAAIEGHRVIGRRARELGVDTVVVFDVHWLVNSGYHVNCGPHFKGAYTSSELPHFIRDMTYEYDGNPALGRRIAETATAAGVKTRAHEIATLKLEYGTLVPMRYMNGDQHFKVVSVAPGAPGIPRTRAGASAPPCARRSRPATAPSWCWPRALCHTVSPTAPPRTRISSG
jgi:3,4-dihydroxyphenylacetate 2,3-dioxygenase